jgi:hypothetical protein
MKKILLIALSGLTISTAIAQQNTSNILVSKPITFVDKKTDEAKPILIGNKNHDNKKTRATKRWYSYVSALDTTLGGNGAVLNNSSGLLIWNDSTIKQLYSGNTLDLVNYSSYYNVLDPKATVFNDPAYYPEEFAVDNSKAYSVDTVVAYGVYRRPKGGNPDTLILSLVKSNSVVAQNNILFYNLGKTSFPEMLVNSYVSGAGSDTSMSMATFEGPTGAGDRIAKNFNSTYIIKKVLTNADTSSFITPFKFAIPTPLSVEAGKLVGASVTYKSGNPWTLNDTVSKMNNYIGIFSEETDGAAQNYRGNSPNFDRSVSGCMFSTSPDSYLPSFFIEGKNNISFDKEIAWIDYHLTCSNCNTVSTSTISSDIKVQVSPNPATTNVNFDLNLVESAKNIEISLTTLTGSLVKTQIVGALNANTSKSVKVNVENLAKGLYIYTINADGKKQTGKVSIN